MLFRLVLFYSSYRLGLIIGCLFACSTAVLCSVSMVCFAFSNQLVCFCCSLRSRLLPPASFRPPVFFYVVTFFTADPVLTTYILLWGSIREPFTKKLIGDEDYLLSFTMGFSELPSPAQVPLQDSPVPSQRFPQPSWDLIKA